MEKHITLVAIFKICFGVLNLILTLIALGVLAGISGGLLSAGRGGWDVYCGPEGIVALLLIVLPLIVSFFALVSALKIIGGIGLLKRKAWARILVLILSCVELIDIPVGTAIGIYSIWVLLQEETVKILAGETNQST